MRILAVSDEEEPWLTSRSCRERLGDIDLVVSCGDLPARYLEHIETLLNVPLAYVWGNHDAGYLEHPPQGCVSIEGRLCDFRGLRIMGLGGSMRYSDRSFVGRSFSWKQNTVLVRVITKIESHWLTIAFTNSVFPFRNSEDANSMNRFARL